MNTKKRWIVTAIVALALAAVVVIGIVLNHSADRVLKATDGTEAAADGTEPSEKTAEEMAEETAEEAPVEETLDLVLPGGANETEITSPDQMSPENEVLPEAAEDLLAETPDQPENAAENPEEGMVLPEASGEDTALDTAGDTGTEMITMQEEGTEESEGSGSESQEERVLITTDGMITTEELQQSAPGSEDTEGQSSEESQEEDPEKEEGAEETEDPDKQEEDEEEDAEEAGETELHATAADGAQITVRKLDGTFPAGTVVKVFVVSSENAQDAVKEALEDSAELVDLVAYDITIYDKDGNEIVPDETVEVSITGASLENGESASVYHIEDDGAAKKVTDLEDSTQASFKPAETK